MKTAFCQLCCQLELHADDVRNGISGLRCLACNCWSIRVRPAVVREPEPVAEKVKAGPVLSDGLFEFDSDAQEGE